MTQETFSELYIVGKIKTYGFLRRKGLIQEVAEEHAQAAWVKAWEKREQFSGISTFQSWVNTIAWHIVLDSRRCKSAEQFPELFDIVAPRLPINEHIDAHKLLGLCTTYEQKLFSVRYFDDLTFDETAIVLAINPSTLRNKIYKAMKRIRPSA